MFLNLTTDFLAGFLCWWKGETNNDWRRSVQATRICMQGTGTIAE